MKTVKGLNMIKWFDHNLLVIFPTNPDKRYIIQNKPHAEFMISVSVKSWLWPYTHCL